MAELHAAETCTRIVERALHCHGAIDSMAE
jgi:alkylation response protein AidB-like acyl-CoA dehydrogenase